MNELLCRIGLKRKVELFDYIPTKIKPIQENVNGWANLGESIVFKKNKTGTIYQWVWQDRVNTLDDVAQAANKHQELLKKRMIRGILSDN